MLNRAPSPSLDDSQPADADTIDMRLTAIVYGADGTNLFDVSYEEITGVAMPGAAVSVSLVITP